MTNDVSMFVASLWCMCGRRLFIKKQEKASALYNHIVVGIIVIPNVHMHRQGQCVSVCVWVSVSVSSKGDHIYVACWSICDQLGSRSSIWKLHLFWSFWLFGLQWLKEQNGSHILVLLISWFLLFWGPIGHLDLLINSPMPPACKAF